MYSLSDYTYHLPDELIAQEAVHPHHNARLMVIDRSNGAITGETTFWNLDTYLDNNRVLFLNNTKVLPARITLEQIPITRPDGSRGTVTGEILFTKYIDIHRFDALIRPGAKFRIGTIFHFPIGNLIVSDMSDTGRILTAENTSIFDLMNTYGKLPLPPYIEYKKEKEVDYQTSFAKKSGSVAAPTASLHFTPELLEKLSPPEYVTLHVGLGTFKGIDTDDIREYHIHQESVEIEKDIFEKIHTLKTRGKYITAVGTTVCRTLESLPYVWKSLQETDKMGYDRSVRKFWDDLSTPCTETYISGLTSGVKNYIFNTEIYIYPGKPIRVIDELITNFHLPESSLLVLVSTLLGREATLNIYEHAIREKYRFFSFGDGMYLRKG